MLLTWKGLQAFLNNRLVDKKSTYFLFFLKYVERLLGPLLTYYLENPFRKIRHVQGSIAQPWPGLWFHCRYLPETSPLIPYCSKNWLPSSWAPWSVSYTSNSIMKTLCEKYSRNDRTIEDCLGGMTCTYNRMNANAIKDYTTGDIWKFFQNTQAFRRVQFLKTSRVV